ncbi:hypothetical protein EVA_15838 [gut metagenome]|uniref:Uncharacterized protein n=1 Tax=gut metagenome TaxID=749906 RepID=J9G2P6_9ZZZZ
MVHRHLALDRLAYLYLVLVIVVDGLPEYLPVREAVATAPLHVVENVGDAIVYVLGRVAVVLRKERILRCTLLQIHLYRSLEMVCSFHIAVVLSVIHFSVSQKLVVVGCATLLETLLAALKFHIVTARLEEAVKALVHEVVQSGSGVGGFQKVVDGSQDVLVCAIACQYATVVREYPAFAPFLVIAFEVVGFRLE